MIYQSSKGSLRKHSGQFEEKKDNPCIIRSLDFQNKNKYEKKKRKYVFSKPIQFLCSNEKWGKLNIRVLSDFGVFMWLKLRDREVNFTETLIEQEPGFGIMDGQDSYPNLVHIFLGWQTPCRESHNASGGRRPRVL